MTQISRCLSCVNGYFFYSYINKGFLRQGKSLSLTNREEERLKRPIHRWSLAVWRITCAQRGRTHAHVFDENALTTNDVARCNEP